MQLTEAATLDRKSGEAEGSAVPRTSPGNAEYDTQTELSSRLPRRAVGPERTRISCHAALDKTGHKDDKVYPGDKSPAYPETEFFRSLFSRQAHRPFTARLNPCPSFDSLSQPLLKVGEGFRVLSKLVN
jgi:hypothetical protein